MPRAVVRRAGRARIDALLARRAGETAAPPRVTRRARAHSSTATPTPAPSAAALAFPMLFYPAEEIRARMAGGGVPRPGRSKSARPAVAGAMAGVSQSYWPTLVSVALMLVALGLTVQAHRRSAELADMQTDFVAHVSHQLKTPLSLLSAATETLQMDRIRSPEKLARVSRHDSRRSGAAVDAGPARARVFARAAGAPLRVRARGLRRADARNRGCLRARTGRPTVHVRRRDRRDRAVRARRSRGDRTGAGQPARQRREVLGRRARRSPSASAASASLAIVEIVDRGVGVAAADQARIFERFYRAPSALASARVRPGPADRARAGAGPRRPGRRDQRARRRQHVPRVAAAGDPAGDRRAGAIASNRRRPHHEPRRCPHR